MPSPPAFPSPPPFRSEKRNDSSGAQALVRLWPLPYLDPYQAVRSLVYANCETSCCSRNVSGGPVYRQLCWVPEHLPEGAKLPSFCIDYSTTVAESVPPDIGAGAYLDGTKFITFLQMPLPLGLLAAAGS